MKQVFQLLLAFGALLGCTQGEELYSLARGRQLQQDTGLLCSAEPNCIDQVCGSAYEFNATNFPYILDYTISGDTNSTSFVFNLCSSACRSGQQFCHALTDFQLRLSDRLLANPDSITNLNRGTVVDSCSPRGPGLLYNRTELGALGEGNPASGTSCVFFRFTVTRPAGSGQLQLRDICQQGVEVVNRNGRVLFDQSEYRPSCLYILRLADKSSGYALLAEKVQPNVSPPPAPSPPLPPFPSPRPPPPPKSSPPLPHDLPLPAPLPPLHHPLPQPSSPLSTTALPQPPPPSPPPPSPSPPPPSPPPPSPSPPPPSPPPPSPSPPPPSPPPPSPSPPPPSPPPPSPSPPPPSPPPPSPRPSPPSPPPPSPKTSPAATPPPSFPSPSPGSSPFPTPPAAPPPNRPPTPPAYSPSPAVPPMYSSPRPTPPAYYAPTATRR